MFEIRYLGWKSYLWPPNLTAMMRVRCSVDMTGLFSIGWQWHAEAPKGTVITWGSQEGPHIPWTLQLTAAPGMIPVRFGGSQSGTTGWPALGSQMIYSAVSAFIIHKARDAKRSHPRIPGGYQPWIITEKVSEVRYNRIALLTTASISFFLWTSFTELIWYITQAYSSHLQGLPG